MKQKRYSAHHLQASTVLFLFEGLGIATIFIGLLSPWACSSGMGDFTWYCPNAFDLYGFYIGTILAENDPAKYSGWVITGTVILSVILLITSKRSLNKQIAVANPFLALGTLLLSSATYINLSQKIAWWVAQPRLGGHEMRFGLLFILVGSSILLVANIIGSKKGARMHLK